jgi:hypothetical protein
VPPNAPATSATPQGGVSGSASGGPTSQDAEIQMLGGGAGPSPSGAQLGKYVFKMECGRFNVLLDGGSDIAGTADYRMPASPPDCCGCCWSPCDGPERLTLLKRMKTNYTYVEVQALTGPITYFRFHWVPKWWGYLVQYSTTGNNDADFHFFGYGQRWTAK